ncbi:MlaD family protein [Spirochaeta africana]|uniref:ABC-type transport system involved in resistance to organic solvents, periplasmic component n=1 Tax=Spirochaeta africana (strain ATCC 700263 / DSM 8902 / Z-7692) TaxID=889378 RepID=H9UGG4_SPIAZ|nr:MlaD family protein [Spirochaeta africana]AFG36607.1 ABC-type transport system involved in resistance to organic solvents, periplasmic component [Spirochaeta africana DSM 8902]
MRLTTEQKIRLGIFWLVGGILTIGFFIWVLGDALLQSRDIYYIEFLDQPVSGLQLGSSVLYQGIQVGRVDDIRFDPEEPRRVTVVLSLQEGVPIKADVEAQLTMTGITGGRQIELIGGSRAAALLPPESYITPGTSLFDNITGDAQIIIAKVEQTLNNINLLLGPDNQQRVRSILAHVDETLAEAGEPLAASIVRLDSITEDLQQLAASAAVISARLEAVTGSPQFDSSLEAIAAGAADLQEITGRIRELTESPEWIGILQNAATTAERSAEISHNLAEIADTIAQVPLAEIAGETAVLLEQFGTTFNRMDMTIIRSSRDVLRSMEILNEILEDLSEFSRIISEDPSSLIRF